MKRLLLSLSIFAVGMAAFWLLRTATTRARRQYAARFETWMAQTQVIAQARMERETIEQSVKESEHELGTLQASGAGLSPDDWFIPQPGQTLSPDQSEKLLARLGFNWNTTGDYIIVSKSTLHALWPSGIQDSKLSNVACEVLAITPAERASIDTTLQRLRAEYNAWAVAHVQREEPSGDVVAKYSLPTDPGFFQSLSNSFAAQVVAALGSERGDLLLRYSGSWMRDYGMKFYGGQPTPTVMTVTRSTRDGGVRIGVEFEQDQGTLHIGKLSPWQPFPQPFQPVFPGGWTELAQREGFQLPRDFSHQPAVEK